MRVEVTLSSRSVGSGAIDGWDASDYCVLPSRAAAKVRGLDGPSGYSAGRKGSRCARIGSVAALGSVVLSADASCPDEWTASLQPARPGAPSSRRRIPSTRQYPLWLMGAEGRGPPGGIELSGRWLARELRTSRLRFAY